MSVTSVLIVDDNLDTCDVLARLLKRDGFSVSCVHRGDQALDWLKTRRPRLLLLDWMMPEMDGFQVLKAIREDPSLDPISVVIFSAVSEPARIGEALRLGAVDYIVKGTPYNDVLSRLTRVAQHTDA